MINYLKGKKTYIVAGLGAVTFAIARLGYISQEVEIQIYSLLGITSVATLRAGVAKK